MARSPIAPGGNNTAGAALSATPWFAPLGGPVVSTAAVEAEQQFRIGVAGAIDRPGIYTTSTAGVSRTVAIRKNGATALAYTPADGVSGALYSTSGSVAVAPGDLVALSAYASTTAGAVSALMANFMASSGHAFLLQCSPSGGVNLAVTGSRSLAVHGTTLGSANGSVNARMLLRVGGTLKGAFVYVSTNAKVTDTTFTLAINNVDSAVVITVPAGQTGFFFAATTDVVVDGDDLAWRYVGADAGAMNVASLGVTLEATSGAKSDIFARPTGTLGRAASATASYAPVNGQFAFSTTQAQKQTALGFPAKLSRFRAYVTGAAYDGPVTVCVNGVASALTFSITTGITGFHEDAAHDVTVGPTDLLSIELTGTGAGSNVFAYIAMTVEDLTPPPTVFSISSSATVNAIGLVPPPPPVPPKSVFAIGGSALVIAATTAPPPADIPSRPGTRIVTAEITAAIDDAGTLQTFYSADTRFTTQPTDSPPNKPFDGSLKDPGSIAVTAFGDGRTGGATRLALGEMRLININGQYDDWLGYAFDGRPVVLRRGTPGDYPGDMQAVFTGTIEALTVTTNDIIVRLRDKQLVFDQKALSNTYLGTNVGGTGVEGTADDIKGQSKPRLFGYGNYLAPPCVNVPKRIYQPSDCPLQDIPAVYVNGAPLTKSVDYPDTTALLAAVLTPGPTYVTCLAEGLFRLAADPGSGEVTCDAIQGATADDRTAAKVLRALALTRIQPAEISDADVAALDAANNAGVGIWVTGDQTLASAMDAVANSVGAHYGFDGAGVLRMARLDAPAGVPVLTLVEADVLTGTFERRPAMDGDIPAWSYTVRHSRVWSPDSDVAGVTNADRRNYLANEYRAERAEDPVVRIKHLMATEQTIDTLLVSASAAAIEAARRLELHKVHRDFFDLAVADDVLHGIDLKIMDVVSLTHSRFGLAGGRLFRLLGQRPQLDRNRTTLTLWG